MDPNDKNMTAAVPDEDDAYEGLLPSEIEGLKEFEAMEAEEAAATQMAKVTAGDDGAPEDDGENDPPENADDTPAEPEQKAEGDKPTAPEPDPEPEPARMDLSKDMDAARSAMNEAKTRLKEVEDQWDNGEIGQEEYDRLKSEAETALDSAESDFDALNTLNKSQELAERQRQESERAKQDAAWNKAQSAFIEQNAEFVRDPKHIEGFNRYVTAITSDPDFQNMPFERQIDIAAQQYLAKLDAIGAEAPEINFLTNAKAPKAKAEVDAENKDASADPKAKERQERGRQMEEPPVTLRDVPSDQVDAYDSTAQRWAALIERETDPDRLDEYMRELAKDPALEERVMQFGA